MYTMNIAGHLIKALPRDHGRQPDNTPSEADMNAPFRVFAPALTAVALPVIFAAVIGLAGG